MKLLVDSSSLLLLVDGSAIVWDLFSGRKFRDNVLYSPWYQGTTRYWYQWSDLFPAYAPYSPCFYWSRPPMLLLPARAESLH